MNKKNLIYVLLIIVLFLCSFIILSFIGYVAWNFFKIDFFLGLFGLLFLVEIYWVNFYWLVLLILAMSYFTVKLIVNKKLIKLTLILVSVAFVIWVIIPYLNDYSYKLILNKDEFVELTNNFKKSANPAQRLQQSSQYIFDAGCNYWLEGWSSDEKFIKISERPYGIKYCIKSNEAILNVESAELIYNYNSIEFLERPWTKRHPEIVNNIIENNFFMVIDALPSPSGDLYVLVISKSSLMGPSDIVLIKNNF